VLGVFEATLTLEVTVDVGLDELVRNGYINELEQLFGDEVACLQALGERVLLCNLLLDLGLELVKGVELRSELSECVVSLWQLALLHSGQSYRNLGLFAGLSATGKLRTEGGRLACGQGVECLVDAVEQVARADLIRNVLGLVDQLVANLGNEVDGGEVALLGSALNGLERAEAATQVVELGVDVLLVDLYLVDLDLEALELRKLDLWANLDLDLDYEVACEGLLVWGLLDVCLWLTERTQLLGFDCIAEDAV